MITAILAKTPPAAVTEPLRELAGYALWLAEVACLAWLIVAAGALFTAKFHGESTPVAAGRIVRVLVGGVMASSAVGIALIFYYNP